MVVASFVHVLLTLSCAHGACVHADDGHWHHIAWVDDGSSIKVYKDNALMGTKAFSGVSGERVFSQNLAKDVFLGAAAVYMLDELKVFVGGAAMTDEERCTVLMGGTWDGSSVCTRTALDGAVSRRCPYVCMC